MPEQTDIYISDIPDAESITNADKVTGIQGNVNKNFTFSSILAWFVNAVKSAFVPVNRTVNGKTLGTNITLTASDVGARPDTWTPTAEGIGAIPATEKGAPLGVAELDSNGQVPSSQIDLSGKQSTITANGILKGDGAGGISAALAGTDYGTYSKPANGIPKSDLSSAVQTSLGRADSAYIKPSNGIPASDLASGVIPSVPSASDATPQALGTAAAGSSNDYSRADHVHQMPEIPSNVEANPSGAATDTLTKLQVDQTIYAVSGGSGVDYLTVVNGKICVIYEVTP